MDSNNISTREVVFAVTVPVCGCAATAYVASLGLVTLPSLWIIAGFTLFSLLMLSMAFPGPDVGFLALERVSQIAVILIFDPLTAAIVAIAAYLIWPFLGFYRKDFALGFSIVRALNNAGMMSLVVLVGGGVYYALGGNVPLTHLDGHAVGTLVAMAVAMQIVNVSFMALLSLIRRQILTIVFSPLANLTELALLPLAALTAIVYNVLPVGGFLLLISALLLLALLMHKFMQSRADLERQVKQLAAVNRLTEAVSASIPIDALARLVYTQCSELLQFSAFHLVLYDRVANELDYVLHQSRGKRMPRRRAPAGEGLLGWLIENNQPTLIQNWNKDKRSELKQRGIIVGEPPAAWVGVPVVYHGRVLGAMSVQNFVPNTFTSRDLELMDTFARQVGAAISNARLFDELEEYKRDLERKVAERTESLRQADATKERLLVELQRKTDALDRLSKEDSLTGLYNRRYMDERMAVELQRAQRFGREIAVAMADIDHFKIINDTCSHSVGDEVLRITARILREACRSTDIISRYGGEEFIICFTETGVDSALNVCERIREMMSSYNWGFVHSGLKVTVSIGVAGGSCYEQSMLQKQADKKLYEAKGSGRDRVCA